MDKPLVIYHNNCPDGFGAAWCVWLRYADDAVYIPANHGDAPPDVRGRDVVIVDFSWPRQTLLDMKATARSLIVLDHHKTAQQDLEGLDFCVFDMNRSGATLAWDYLVCPDPMARHKFGDIPRDFVAYLQDRDLWTFILPFSREVSVALWSYPKEFAVWSKLARRIDILAEEGAAILRYQQQLVEQMCRQFRFQIIAGYNVPVVNASTCFSEVGEYLANKYPTAPFGAYYFDRADNKRQWGARVRNGSDFDVSVVAKSLGGGGHRAAAGWQEDMK